MIKLNQVMKRLTILTKTSPKSLQNDYFRYFKVYYTKDVNKMSRVFSQGILACQNQNTRLFDAGGQVLIKIPQKIQPQKGQEYVIGHQFSVLISCKINREDIFSKQIFNQLLTNNVSNEATQLENGLEVDNNLLIQLRQHQVQGVQFMYDCLMQFKSPSICGCILADFISFDKKLQTIILIHSLLKIKKILKCIIISPLNLVDDWGKQCKKWLKNPLVVFDDEEKVQNVCQQFCYNQYQILLINYKDFNRHYDILDKKCDLLVCDEGLRLKNTNSKAFKNILDFSCKKKILLTSTPLHNNLDQLYSCILAVNSSLFSSKQQFENLYKIPILNGISKKATSYQKKIAINRTLQLANKLKEFCLRRKTDILQKYHPIKKEYVVLFKLTCLQSDWYDKLLDRLQERKQSEPNFLSFLNLSRKLFTHPQILQNDCSDQRNISQFSQDLQNQISSKINFVLNVCVQKVALDEKVIIVSYFTQTLDFIANHLRQYSLLTKKNLSLIMLDERVNDKERQNILSQFQRQKSILLLSSKQETTKLSLISARTMIIIQPDWNPSNDAQVIGRVWRQGQAKQVDIYRLITISSVEQRIIQRQKQGKLLSKQLIYQEKSIPRGEDFFCIKNLFVQSSQKSLFFSQYQNKLQYVYPESGINWYGLIVQTNKQPDKDQLSNGISDLKQINQFSDGILMFDEITERQVQKQNRLREKRSSNQVQFDDDYKQQENQLQDKKFFQKSLFYRKPRLFTVESNEQLLQNNEHSQSLDGVRLKQPGQFSTKNRQQFIKTKEVNKINIQSLSKQYKLQSSKRLKFIKFDIVDLKTQDALNYKQTQINKQRNKLYIKQCNELDELILQQQKQIKYQKVLQFQKSILKIKLNEFVYGYNIIQDLSQLDQTNQRISQKLQCDNQTISFIDIKISILTYLYPIPREILSFYSYESPIYQFMYSFEKKQEQIIVNTLKQRIQRQLQQKKQRLSLQNYLKKQKNKTILFVCSQAQLQKIMQQLKIQLKMFKNGLIEITGLSFQYVSNQYYEFSIQYNYQKIKLLKKFNILHKTEIHKDLVRQITILKSQSEIILFWFEAKKPLMQKFNQIHKNIMECDLKTQSKKKMQK